MTAKRRRAIVLGDESEGGEHGRADDICHRADRVAADRLARSVVRVERTAGAFAPAVLFNESVWKARRHSSSRCRFYLRNGRQRTPVRLVAEPARKLIRALRPPVYRRLLSCDSREKSKTFAALTLSLWRSRLTDARFTCNVAPTWGRRNSKFTLTGTPLGMRRSGPRKS